MIVTILATMLVCVLPMTFGIVGWCIWLSYILFGGFLIWSLNKTIWVIWLYGCYAITLISFKG